MTTPHSLLGGEGSQGCSVDKLSAATGKASVEGHTECLWRTVRPPHFVALSKACAGSRKAPLCGTVSATVSSIFISMANNENEVSCSGRVDSEGCSLTVLPLEPVSQGLPGLCGERTLCQNCPQWGLDRSWLWKAFTSPFSPQGRQGIIGYYVQPLRHRALSAQLSPESGHFFMCPLQFSLGRRKEQIGSVWPFRAGNLTHIWRLW